MPETSVRELAAEAKAKLSAQAVRIVGAPDLRSGKVGFSAGAPAPTTQMRMLQRDDVEVLVAGESREWETVEYARDAADLGLPKALILLGHCASEEEGMRHCAEWLAEMMPSLRVELLPAGDPFRTV